MGVIGALQSFAVTNVLAANGGPNGDGVTAVFWLYRRVIEYDNMLEYAEDYRRYTKREIILDILLL